MAEDTYISSSLGDSALDDLIWEKFDHHHGQVSAEPASVWDQPEHEHLPVTFKRESSPTRVNFNTKREANIDQIPRVSQQRQQQQQSLTRGEIYNVEGRRDGHTRSTQHKDLPHVDVHDRKAAPSHNRDKVYTRDTQTVNSRAYVPEPMNNQNRQLQVARRHLPDVYRGHLYNKMTNADHERF